MGFPEASHPTEPPCLDDGAAVELGVKVDLMEDALDHLLAVFFPRE